jgi:hypothetical protein
VCEHLAIPGGTGDTTGRNPAQNGGVGPNAAGGAGGENTGGGGGGGTDLDGNGGNAGKGIVIIRYTDANGQQAGGGTVTAPSGYIVHTFTGDGTFATNTFFGVSYLLYQLTN